MKNNEDVEQKEPSAWKWWGISGAICLSVWLLGICITRWYADTYLPSVEGENAPALFGDSFGGVNALISALAFAGMLVSFVLQRYELRLQREELKAQRDEFTQQNKTLKLQRFENTFFNMMQLQQQIVNDLQFSRIEKETIRKSLRFDVDDTEFILDKKYQGRELFEFLFCHDDGKTQLLKYYGIGIDLANIGWKSYNDSFERSLLDHYFLHFYTILRFIDETEAFDTDELGQRNSQYTFKQKYHYATILRATLSRYELILLYYNGLSDFGRDRLKPLLEKYSMLNNINWHLLTLTLENRNLCKVPNGKEPQGYLRQHGLIGTDFEFYLTDEDEEDITKYRLSAFCTNNQEITKLLKMIEVRDVFLKNANGPEVEK